MITKFINPVLLAGLTRRRKPGRLANQTAEGTPAIVVENSASEIKKIVNGSVVTFEGTYQGKPIRVRIFNESLSRIKPWPE
jgi:hypothetical protein